MEAGAAGGGGGGLPDAALLAPLTEDSFVHNLQVRFMRDAVYTYVGGCVVCVNPGRALPLYSAELARQYGARAAAALRLPPHVYAVAAAALARVRDRRQPQCIVVTGESGAGKTEAARLCLQCALLAAPAPAPALAAPLAAAGTLLEAFGNAATQRNHNASRFGKLLEIEVDFKGEPVCGHITHYLLETERAYRPPRGERNFHVLYQLLAGADVSLLKRLKLQRSWQHYRILGGGGAGEPAAAGARAAAHDTEHFAFTTAAMGALGLPAADSAAVLRALAFMLKLGNVRFEPHNNIDGSIGTRLHPPHEVREACALVGADADALAEALTAAHHAPHLPPAAEPGAEHEDAPDDSAAESEPAEYGGDAEWARAALDRLLGALYSRLFTWLVRRAEAALRAPAAPAPAGAPAALALLDLYGFEALAENGLERLLINYAAERLQACVAAGARREQEEYAREGLPWRALPARDADGAADLLDAGPESVLGALRAAAARAEPARALLERLARRRHPRLRVHPPDRFTVVHFAGAVTYSARGMACKNRDAVCRACGAVLGGARDALLAELFAAERGAAPPSPRRPAARSCRQRALVAALVRRLPPTPRLVRCLRADAALRPHRFDAALVRHQNPGDGHAATRRVVRVHVRARAAGALRRAGARAARVPRARGRGRGRRVRARRARAAAPAAHPGRRVRVRPLARVHPQPAHRVGAGGVARRARGRARVVRAARLARAPRAAAARRGAHRVARVAGVARAPRLGRRAGRRGAPHLALVVRGRAAPVRGGAVGAAAGAARVARVRRLAAAGRAAAAGPRGRAAPAAAPRVALPRVPRRVRPDGAEPHAREGHGQRAVPRPQGHVRRQRGAPLRGRLRAPARVGRVAARSGRAGRPLRGVRGRGWQGGARVGPRGARAGRAVHSRAAAAGRALVARAPPRARARRARAVTVAARGRRAGGARASAARAAARPARPLRPPRHPRPAHRPRRRARLSVRRRGSAAAARRRGAAHGARAGAGHQAVPGGAERRGRATARHRGLRIRGQLRLVRGDGGVSRRGRGRLRRRRAHRAPRRPHGRAALSRAGRMDVLL